MKKDIIISGVGGQGILSISAVIGMAALENNLHMKQAEVHGMSQRGGDVQSNLRISSEPIWSDLIQKHKADLIISVEPMEALRYVAYLKPGGWIITNTTPEKNIPDYTSDDEIAGELANYKTIAFNADEMAKASGSARSGNMVILGAASHWLDIPVESLEMAIANLFGRKGDEVVATNLKAFRAGRDEAAKHL